MPRNPPPEQPIRTYPSPDIADQVVLEWVTSELAASAPVEPGTAHPNTRDFSGFKFGKQVVNPTDHNFSIRYYVKDQPSPDTFTPAWNYALKYSGQSNSAPILIRAYRKLKSGYTPLAKGTALADYPAAYLVEEEAQQFPIDSEFYALYFNVVRVYETLPGPYLPANRYDADLGVITGRRRAVVNSSQVAAVTTSHSLRYEAREGSSIVSWEIEESWDNTAFPTNKTDFYDNDRGAVHQTTQLTTDTTTAGSLAAPSTTATLTRYEPFPENSALRKKIIETWTVPGPVQGSTEFQKDGVKKVVTRQQMKVGNILTTEALAAGVLTRKFKERLNEVLAFQIIETITVDDGDLLDLPSFTTSIPNVIPEIFRALIPTHVESHIIEGTAAETALVTGEFEHTERQLTPLYMEVRSEILDSIGSLPITVTGQKETNAQKQVVTVAMKLCVDSTTPTVPTALIDIDFRKLGNGLAFEITKTIQSVFDAALFAKERPDNLPERFRAAIPASTTRHTVSGTAAAPSLSTGDTAKSERQQDTFVKETSVTNRDVSSPPTLAGQDYEQELDVIVPYTETIEAAGTSIGTNRRIVTPLGGGSDLVRGFDATTLEAALGAYLLSYPGTTNLQLPDVLESVTGIIESTTGDGDYSEDGSASWLATGSGGGSASLSLRGSGQGSAAIIPDVAIGIKQTWASNIPTTHYMFFLQLPVTVAAVLSRLTTLAAATINAWPKFSPKSHTFTLIGQRVSLQCTASSNWQDGGSAVSLEHSESSGSGSSRELGLTVRTVRVPPTIHGTVSVGGTTSDSEGVSASAHADASISADVSASATVYGSITPTSLSATPNTNAIPTTGLYLLHVDADPYRWGWARIHCEVVNFANVG